MKQNITKFIFADLGQQNHTDVQTTMDFSNAVDVDKVVSDGTTDVVINAEAVDQVDVKQHNVQATGMISISESEFNIMLANAAAQGEAQAFEKYKKQEDQDSSSMGMLLTKIEADVIEIKEKIDVEFNAVLDKTIALAYAIASKILDVTMMKISSEDFIFLLKARVPDFVHASDISIEMNHVDAAAISERIGMKVNVNNEMLPGDYKINWNSGFISKDTRVITQMIEEVLLEHMSPGNTLHNINNTSTNE